jgi:hypothetical protein
MRASAKTCLGVRKPPVAANVAEPMQQKQKPRRVNEYWRAEAMVPSSFVD